MKFDFNKKTILITGGTGSWGHELVRQLFKFKIKEIRIFSRGELAQVNMQRYFNNDYRLKFIIGDIRDYDTIKKAISGVDAVFNLAALKHVPVCEDNPWESVHTNIIGAKNVIDACIYNKVKIVVLSSTDKACAPFNFYGCCKSVTEKLFVKANKNQNVTQFVCVRAGNVIGTNGSIVPFFKNLILSDKKVPITNDKMTRYYMDVSAAIELLFTAIKNCKGGEIFVTKMPACRIIDVVNVIGKICLKEPKIKIVGIRQGEKIHEMLVSEHEALYTVITNKFMVILPMDGSLDMDYKQYKKLKKAYTSNDKLLTQKQLIDLIKESEVL